MSGYLMDTSVFVATEHARPLGSAPIGKGHVSVATLTELRVGALRATPRDSPAREATVARAENFIALVYDEHVGRCLAGILAEARTQRRRAGAMDAIIAATALAHDLTVWTQDDDFDVLQELAPQLRVHRG